MPSAKLLVDKLVCWWRTAIESTRKNLKANEQAEGSLKRTISILHTLKQTVTLTTSTVEFSINNIKLWQPYPNETSDIRFTLFVLFLQNVTTVVCFVLFHYASLHSMSPSLNCVATVRNTKMLLLFRIEYKTVVVAVVQNRPENIKASASTREQGVKTRTAIGHGTQSHVKRRRAGV